MTKSKILTLSAAALMVLGVVSCGGTGSTTADKVKHASTLTYDQLVEESRKEMDCLLYTSPSPRDAPLSRMPSSA